jgi:hypothetical protein
MDGFRSAGAAGILYAEDFGQEQRPMPPPSAPDAPPRLTQADIDAACIQAVAAAERAWAASTAERSAETLGAMRAAIAGLHQHVAEHAETVADGIARTALSAVAGALPHLCRTHGDAEAQAMLQHVLPLLARRAQVVVRVHSSLIEAVQADIGAFDETLASQISLRAADLAPGDVRLHWEDGGMARDGAAICAAIQDGLMRLGLLDPAPDPEATPRSTPLGQ